MKKYTFLVYVLIVCMSFSNLLTAQNLDSLSLNDLEIPNSPGFILLDKSPTSIERPNSSKAFVISLLNSVYENKGVPQNYAMEFTPFWFVKHSKMSALKFAGYNPEKDKQLIFANIKKFSVSIASIATIDEITDMPLNNLSFGVRTNIISIRSKTDIEDLKVANAKMVRYVRGIEERLIEAGIIYNPAKMTREEYDKKVKEFLIKEEKERKSDNNDFSEIIQRRAIFAVDGAIGYSRFYINNSFSGVNFGRFGAWITANYSKGLNKEKSNYLNAYAVGRFISDGTVFIDNEYLIQNFIDYGAKIELEFKNLSIAYEYIYRSNDDITTYRSNGILKYKISDTLYLTGALGKNFGDNNNLISLFGLNWGILNRT